MCYKSGSGSASLKQFYPPSPIVVSLQSSDVDQSKLFYWWYHNATTRQPNP